MELRKAIDSKFNEFVTLKGLAQGSEPVSIVLLLKAFTRFAGPTLPVTKTKFGRLMSKDFMSKIDYKTNRMLYFLNKQL